MYINYNVVNGIEYGTATHSVRKGSNVGKGDQIYLGRVIDKDKGIFKSRERGLFVYDVETNIFPFLQISKSLRGSGKQSILPARH